MCNLYNVTTSTEAMRQFTRAMRDLTGFNEPSRDVHPGYMAPVVRVGVDGQREIAPLTWGMPTPSQYVGNYDKGVTNIRNVGSPHWRQWLGPASRCVVPFTSVAEPDPASKVEGGRTPNAWFARDESRPLMAFAGFWTPWKGVKKVRDGEREFELYGFLTTSPNAIVSPIHQKAMPVNLVALDEDERWYILGAPNPRMWAGRREFFPAPAYAKTFDPATVWPRGPIGQTTDLPPITLPEHLYG